MASNRGVVYLGPGKVEVLLYTRFALRHCTAQSSFIITGAYGSVDF
jgi:hypothetical protein